MRLIVKCVLANETEDSRFAVLCANLDEKWRNLQRIATKCRRYNEYVTFGSVEDRSRWTDNQVAERVFAGKQYSICRFAGFAQECSYLPESHNNEAENGTSPTTAARKSKAR